MNKIKYWLSGFTQTMAWVCRWASRGSGSPDNQPEGPSQHPRPGSRTGSWRRRRVPSGGHGTWDFMTCELLNINCVSKHIRMKLTPYLHHIQQKDLHGNAHRHCSDLIWNSTNCIAKFPGEGDCPRLLGCQNRLVEYNYLTGLYK